jgi:hypothetical protein
MGVGFGCKIDIKRRTRHLWLVDDALGCSVGKCVDDEDSDLPRFSPVKPDLPEPSLAKRKLSTNTNACIIMKYL